MYAATAAGDTHSCLIWFYGRKRERGEEETKANGKSLDGG